MQEFKIIRRKTGAIMAHNTKPIWIVRYPATMDRAKFYQAYVACEGRRIPGQHPGEGGVDNKRIGDSRGFKTLQSAKDAVQSFNRVSTMRDFI